MCCGHRRPGVAGAQAMLAAGPGSGCSRALEPLRAGVLPLGLARGELVQLGAQELQPGAAPAGRGLVGNTLKPHLRLPDQTEDELRTMLLLFGRA